MPGGGFSPEFDFDETKPAGSTVVADGDNWIRSNQQHVDNALAKEHYAPSSDPDFSEDDTGAHYYITLKELADKPSVVDTRVFVTRHALFAKSDGIYVEDSSGNATLLFGFTDQEVPAGTLPDDIQESYAAIPQDEIIVFDKDTEVVGYTLQVDVDDVLLFITKGSEEGGETGGGAHSGGTWTIDIDHSHTVDIYACDKTGTILTDAAYVGIHIGTGAGNNAWNVQSGAPASAQAKGKRETSASPSVTEITTWRPAA